MNVKRVRIRKERARRVEQALRVFTYVVFIILMSLIAAVVAHLLFTWAAEVAWNASIGLAGGGS